MSKIKRITKFTALVGDKDELINEFKRHMQEFDEQQNCIKEVEYTSSGGIESASIYKFNNQNQMTGEIHYFDEDEVGEKIEYRLDESGKVKEIEIAYADDSKSIKKINRSEHKITVKAYDEDGEAEGEESVKFDQKGRTIEELRLDEDGIVSQRIKYTYDDSDQALTRVEYGEKDEFHLKTLFAYDDKGNMIQRTRENGKGKPIDSSLFEYDEHDNQTVIQTNQHLQRTAYDDENRVASQETSSRANNMVENFTEYKYGEHGLVIEERSFEMGDAYQLEPGVFSRSGSNFIVTRYDYEFYDTNS